MRTFRLHSLFCVAVLMAATPFSFPIARSAAAPVAATLVAGSFDQKLQVGGRERSFVLHVPPAATGKTALPLVLCFHGGGGRGRGQENRTGWSMLADAHGFLIAYPDGLDGHWNDGRVAPRLGEAASADDVAFARALVGHLQGRFRVDQRRIFACGHSNGGIFAQRLGVEMSDTFAAIASVAGAIPVGKNEVPLLPRPDTPPLSVLMIHGTEDSFVFWDGGAVRGRGGGATLSVAQTIAAWVKHNRCEPKARIEILPDVDPHDKTRVRRETYSQGTGATAVALYAIVGGGHSWPGATARRVPIPGENLSRDIDAARVIWEFFEAHPKP